MIAALCTTVFFAITPVFANRAAGLLGSTRANFWRLIVAFVLLGAWTHAAGNGRGGPAFPWFVAGGVVGFGIGGLAMFEALPRLGSNLANLIVQCASAVTAATVEWLWLGTRLTPLQVAAAALTLIGITVGLLPWSNRKLTASAAERASRPRSDGRAATPLAAVARNGVRALPAKAGDRWGYARSRTWSAGLAWALLSAIAQGIGAVMSRKAFAIAAAVHQAIDPGTAAYERVLGGAAVAAVALAVVGWCQLEPPPCGWPAERPASGEASYKPVAAPYWVLANALTGPVLGVTCYQWALRTTPAGIVQPVVAAAPLLTIPFAAWLEHSRPRPTYYLGAVLAVIGVTTLMLAR